MNNQSLHNFPIAKGTKFIWNSIPHEIKRRVNQNLYQVEFKDVLHGNDVASTKQVDATELISLYKKGHIRVILESNGPRNFINGEPRNQILWESFSNEEKEEALRRYQYVLRTWDMPLTKSNLLEQAITQIAIEIADKSNPPAFSTLAIWRKAFKDSGMDVASLGPKNQWKGNRKEKYCEAVKHLTKQAIDDWYLRPEKMTYTGLERMVLASISYHNELNPDMPLPYPGREYIKNKVNEVPEYVVSLNKHGKEKTHEKYKVNRGTTPILRPLERLEMDHTPLDVMVVHPTTGIVMGRPTLTIIIDVATRCIVGFYITMDKPGYRSVQKCLLIALQKKDYIKSKFPNIENTWDCFGQFNELLVDGGKEFHSDALESGANELGVTIKFLPRRRGQDKPHVERVQGTINQFCHQLSGTTFSNIFQKGDYDPAKYANLTLDKLNELLHSYIIDVYHQNEHPALKMSPSQAWKEQTKEHPVYLNHTQQELEQALSLKEERMIGNKGISLNNIHYKSDELERIKQKNGPNRKYQIRYNPDNLDTIELVDHLGGYQTFTLTAYSINYCHLNTSFCLSDWKEMNTRVSEEKISLARAYASILLEAAKQERPGKKRAKRKTKLDDKNEIDTLENMLLAKSAGYQLNKPQDVIAEEAESIILDNNPTEIIDFPILDVDTQRGRAEK